MKIEVLQIRVACIALGCLAIAGCSPSPATVGSGAPIRRPALKGSAGKVVEGAKMQLQNPASYTGAYFKIPYPNGDVPADKGACVDVVIRALRHAGYDLQRLIHEDISKHLSAYPRHESHPDSSIDHRRVPNQRHFFAKFGLSLRTDANLGSWLPGDIVTWKLDSGLDHTGVLSDDIGPSGFPMVIHNLSRTAEEDVLTRWKITGHYRYPKR